MPETNICYDYELGQVRVFTDRAGVANQITKRLDGKAEVIEGRQGDRITSWTITIPLECCRHAYAITKVLAGDEDSNE